MNTCIDYETVLNNYASCKLSKRQMLAYFKNDGQMLRDYLRKIKQAAEVRSMITKERSLEVAYIQGPAGSGKTTAAKYFAEKLHYDYFVSGSGEDMLDGYDKEECIILDDFRGGSMKFSELLKFLDNNTGSSVKSRYYNKDINNCKLIVITSVLKPEQLYQLFTDASGEPIEQLMRRLKHHYYYIKDDYMYEFKTINEESYKFMPVDDIYKYFNIDPKKVDDNSILEQFRTCDNNPTLDENYKDTRDDTVASARRVVHFEF